MTWYLDSLSTRYLVFNLQSQYRTSLYFEFIHFSGYYISEFKSNVISFTIQDIRWVVISVTWFIQFLVEDIDSNSIFSSTFKILIVGGLHKRGSSAFQVEITIRGEGAVIVAMVSISQISFNCGSGNILGMKLDFEIWNIIMPLTKYNIIQKW